MAAQTPPDPARGPAAAGDLPSGGHRGPDRPEPAAPTRRPTAAGVPAADAPGADVSGAGVSEAEVADAVDAVLRGRLRRAPRYGAFIVAGVVVGLVVGLVAPFFGRGGWTGGVALFLGASGVVVGAVTGAAVAALVDLRSTR